MEGSRWPAWVVPGLQMALAVLLAFAAAQLLQLPEALWAVMSALIVARPHSGAALGAGAERLLGTLIGCAAGVAAAVVLPRGAGLPLPGLAAVAVVAFASAARTGWRSAPIAALIVVSGSGGGAVAPLQLALLRVAEVALGVLVGTVVPFLLPGTRSAALFERAVAALLLDLAAQLRSAEPIDEAAATAQRKRLRSLGEVAIGADRVRHALRRLPGDEVRPRPAADRPHQRQAALCGRIAQDVALFARTRQSLAISADDAGWLAAGAAGSKLLETMATDGPTARAALAAFKALRDPGTPLELPVAWLAEDLHKLLRLRAAG